MGKQLIYNMITQHFETKFLEKVFLEWFIEIRTQTILFSNCLNKLQNLEKNILKQTQTLHLLEVAINKLSSDKDAVRHHLLFFQLCQKHFFVNLRYLYSLLRSTKDRSATLRSDFPLKHKFTGQDDSYKLTKQSVKANFVK